MGAVRLDTPVERRADRDVPKLNLMVRGDNENARGFYSALGYAQDDVVVLARRLER